MINFLTVDVFDVKVFNNKGEGDVTDLLKEEAQGVTGFYVAIFLEVLDKVVVGNFSSFFEAIPNTFDFGVDIAINNFFFKVVVEDDLDLNEVLLETDILGIQ